MFITWSCQQILYFSLHLVLDYFAAQRHPFSPKSQTLCHPKDPFDTCTNQVYVPLTSLYSHSRRQQQVCIPDSSYYPAPTANDQPMPRAIPDEDRFVDRTASEEFILNLSDSDIGPGYIGNSNEMDDAVKAKVNAAMKGHLSPKQRSSERRQTPGRTPSEEFMAALSDDGALGFGTIGHAVVVVESDVHAPRRNIKYKTRRERAPLTPGDRCPRRAEPQRGVGRTPSEEFAAALSDSDFGLGNMGHVAMQSSGRRGAPQMDDSERDKIKQALQEATRLAAQEAAEQEEMKRKTPARTISSDSHDNYNKVYFYEH